MRVTVGDAGDGTSTLESVTDLQLTGRIAALGRGVQDVSNTMFQDFAGQLAVQVAAPEPVAEPVGRSAGTAGGGSAPTATLGGQRTATAPPPRRRPRTRSS